MDFDTLRRFKFLRVKPCREIKGTVSVSGAKNSALPLLAGSLLTKRLVLENFPRLLDTFYALQILERLGKTVNLFGNKVEIWGEITSVRVPFEFASLFRGSILFLGALLGAVGRAEVVHPGGCAIGSRPIDQHLKFLERIGADISVEGGYIKVELPKIPKIRSFTFDVVTVTGTENALLTLLGFEGEFELHNVALEPEVFDLLEFLKKLGLKISTRGRSFKIWVPPKGERKEELSHRVIPDRIEAGTFLVIGALLGNPLKVENIEPTHLEAVISKLQVVGANLKVFPNKVEIWRGETLKGTDIETAPYPGFPTDMQAQFMAMLSVAEGTSLVVENIFENRFQHALELSRMGANIEIRGRTALVKGVNKLTGAPVRATDLRASASLVIAGLIAEGETVIHDIAHLLRGYEKMEEKLRSLGCEVELLP